MTITIKVVRDECADSPREWDNLGVIAFWHRRYSLGDVQPDISMDDWLAENAPDGSVVLPVYMYDHGGISLSTKPFSCRWDSGRVGCIVATPDRIEERFGPGSSPQTIEDILRSEIQIYDAFVQGDVWGFIISESNACGLCGHVAEENHDACFGFIGPDALADMKDHVSSRHHALLDKAWDDRFRQ